MPQATPIRLTPSSWPLACSAYPFVDCSDWIRINTLPSPAELNRRRQCTAGRHHDEPDIILFEDRSPSRPDFDDSGVTFQNILPIEIAAAIDENLGIAGKTVDQIPAPLICCNTRPMPSGSRVLCSRKSAARTGNVPASNPTRPAPERAFTPTAVNASTSMIGTIP